MKMVTAYDVRPHERPFALEVNEAIELLRLWNVYGYPAPEVEGLRELRRWLAFDTPEEVEAQVRSGDWLLIHSNALAFDWGTFEKKAFQDRVSLIMEEGGTCEPWEPRVFPPRDPNRDRVFAKSNLATFKGVIAGTQRETGDFFGLFAVLSPTGKISDTGESAFGTTYGSTVTKTTGRWAACDTEEGSGLSRNLMLVLWPPDNGDLNFYDEPELRGLESAKTRVRFQLRPKPDGTLRIYGTHTPAGSGADEVPVVHVRSTGEHQYAAELHGVSLTWGGYQKPHVNTETFSAKFPRQDVYVYPRATGPDADNDANPPPEDGWRDAILSFPAGTGILPLYIAFASPPVAPLIAEPGFYVVPNAMPRSELEALLFATQDSAVLEKFRTLNNHITQYAKPGQLIILSDPRNTQCTREEALLTEAAALVDAALEPMSDEEAAFMVRHHGEIESFLGNGSLSVGVGAAMAGQHLKALETVLKDLDSLHRTTFAKHQMLSGAEFFAERKRLLSQLDVSLNSLVRRGVGIPEHPKLKTALGISSRSLVHHWKKAGVAGDIPGYATHINGVARAAKYMKIGGFIGIGIGAVAGGLEIKEVCRVGSEEECEKVKFVEAGKFSGSVVGGAVAGEVATSLATAVCPAVAVSTAVVGGVICVAVLVGVGSAVGSLGGAALGDWFGEKAYTLEQ